MESYHEIQPTIRGRPANLLENNGARPVPLAGTGAALVQAMKNKILLVDDDAAVRKSLARALEAEGFDVLAARSGREAIREFLAEPPDLVLLDLNMPGKDGWHTFDYMEKQNPLVPVIVITARPNQFERAVVSGIDALMEKPLDLPLLLNTIKRLLQETAQERISRLTQPDFATAFLSRDGAPANRVR
jgi:DNA-binding response OmpR family regulator